MPQLNSKHFIKLKWQKKLAQIVLLITFLGITRSEVAFAQQVKAGETMSEIPAASTSLDNSPATTVMASPPKLTFYLGKILEITSEETKHIDTIEYFIQTVKVRNMQTGTETILVAGSEFQPLTSAQRLSVGKTVILSDTTTSDNEVTTAIADIYRLPQLAWLLAFFAVVVLLVASLRGAMAFLGMVISIAVLVGYVVPNILKGSDPLFLCFGAGTMIAAATMYLQHGWKKRTHIAFISIVVSLLVVAIIAQVTARAASLVGFGNEEASFLYLSIGYPINLQGLLLGGILLGALGVLDDVVVSQVSIVAQLKAANSKLTIGQLYKRALEVGKDHVASLVNTLVLAYAGANLPLFLLLAITPNTPFWVVLNNQTIAEEIVRTAAGSIGLVLAVPLTTFIAAKTMGTVTAAEIDDTDHHH